MNIEKLRYTGEDQKLLPADSLNLIAGQGIEGDCGKRKADGRVTLMAGEAELFPRYGEGLCVRRFRANIITQGLDYASLSEGMRLSVGDAVLVINRVGKPCFPECSLRQKGTTCPLPGNVAFATIAQGGRIAAGDEISRF